MMLTAVLCFVRYCGYIIKVRWQGDLTFMRHTFLVVTVKMVKIGRPIHSRKLLQN